MTDSTPPGGLDSPPSTGTPQPLPPPTPARQPCPAEDAKRPARQRQHHAQHAEGQGQRAKADGETPGHRPPRLPTSTPPRRPSATSRQQPPARIPSRLESATASNPHDQHDQQGRGEGKRRRATDEEPRPRVKNFFTRPYIGRTPPRYTPKDTPAACILHRSSVLFPLVLRPVLTACNSAFGEFAEPDAQNARQQTQRTPARLHHAHQWTGEPLHFQPAAISDEMTQCLYSIASTHFLSFFPR